jgi:hypothetical protein
MNGFKVVSNVPIKPRGQFPFGEMKEGDSFGFDIEKIRQVAAGAWQYGKRFKMKFSVRKNGKEGRCWRVK